MGRTNITVMVQNTCFVMFGSCLFLCIVYLHIVPHLHLKDILLASVWNHASSSSHLEQFKQMFPVCGQHSGYCGAEFHCEPPQGAEYALNSRQDAETEVETLFFECRGTPMVKHSSFLGKSPWIIPLLIASFEPNRIQKLTNALPKQMKSTEVLTLSSECKRNYCNCSTLITFPIVNFLLLLKLLNIVNIFMSKYC